MSLNLLEAISPLDGRYRGKVAGLAAYFSESALIQHRVQVEVEWLIHICNEAKLEGTREINSKEKTWLRNLYKKFTLKNAQAVKDIEKTTNHDVKAVEYFLKDKMKKHSTKQLTEFVHFACTSEDINNLSYALMLKGAVDNVMKPKLAEIECLMLDLAKKGAQVPMLSHTHGQPASPTTVGKEVMNVFMRFVLQTDQLRDQAFLGKINGATGNWNAHHVAYPDEDWIGISYTFVESLGLFPMIYTTQIEPHDFIAELCHNMIRINNIILDFDRDMWTYISKNYFNQKLKKGEVGSSTMPHKVNPIDFENSEGNIGLANAMLSHLAEKLPVSRMQRDLTDSTVLRNLGVAFGYSLLACQSTIKGLSKVEINQTQLKKDLNAHWEILGEALQTVMRRYKIAKPYEKLKKLTRGKGLNKLDYQAFIKTLKIPKHEKERLSKLTPATYTGLAQTLTDMAFMGEE
jgi:adenylosuccinate lyase